MCCEGPQALDLPGLVSQDLLILQKLQRVFCVQHWAAFSCELLQLRLGNGCNRGKDGIETQEVWTTQALI